MPSDPRAPAAARRPRPGPPPSSAPRSPAPCVQADAPRWPRRRRPPEPRAGARRRASRELGAFAAGRIDLDRFAGLVDRGRAPLDAAARDALERAPPCSRRAAAPARTQVVVPTSPDGAAMRDAVDAALARARPRVRRGAHRRSSCAGALPPRRPTAPCSTALPFRAWTRPSAASPRRSSSRSTGADLHAGALVDFARRAREARAPRARALRARRRSCGSSRRARSCSRRRRRPGLGRLRAGPTARRSRRSFPTATRGLPPRSRARGRRRGSGSSCGAAARRRRSAGRRVVSAWQRREDLAQLAALAERPRRASGAAPTRRRGKAARAGRGDAVDRPWPPGCVGRRRPRGTPRRVAPRHGGPAESAMNPSTLLSAWDPRRRRRSSSPS